MKNKTQNQPKDNGNETKREMFDVFISYRHLDTKDPKKNPDHKHTTSLAWSIYQALYTEGFHAFVDCKYGLEGALPALDNSRHFIILFTADSIIPLEKYSYDKIKEMIEEGKKGEEGDGFNYARELYEIEKRINNNPETKNNVFLLNIDERTDNISEILTKGGYNKLGEIIRTPFNTDQRFLSSINDLIKSKNGNRNRKRLRKKIHVFNKEIPWVRFGYNTCKTISKITLVLSLLLVVSTCFFGIKYRGLNKSFDNRLNDSIKTYCDSINKLNNELNQYKNKEFVVFAGGRSVQQYIAQKYKVNVDQYNEPNAIYFHQPSTTATQFLWDDVNEDDPRKLCPIILSATEIDTNNANISELKSRGRRIAAYLVDKTPMKVQVFNHHGSKIEIKPITPEGLRKLLKEENTTIWTTTKDSGTYLEYKKLLDINGVFNLDDIVNKQKNGRCDFDLVKHIDFSNKTQQHIFLANNYYYYPYDNPDNSLSIVMDNSITATIPLYVYTIATVNSNNKLVELLPRAKEFLDKIECNTEEPITIPNGIIATWPKLEEK